MATSALTTVAAVDIGTNSMRMLVVRRIGSGTVEMGRWERVTGLGRGVDATGELSPEAVDRTLIALLEFGGRMRQLGVEMARAVATSASRDAANREAFLDRAETALGVRPELITGVEEAALSYAGATSRVPPGSHPLLVDIGGGSTEFVVADGGRSIDIGSVRLTERSLPSRPASAAEVEAARRHCLDLFSVMSVPPHDLVLGSGGTWTSLAAVGLGGDGVDGAIITKPELDQLVVRLAALDVEETARLPGLVAARAPVILGGAVVAQAALKFLQAGSARVSVADILDGIAAQLLAEGGG
jgi:exopolyphosphatase/guanosine-5'-triphosphate,3'-diphosphate pyrophosphatase